MNKIPRCQNIYLGTQKNWRVLNQSWYSLIWRRIYITNAKGVIKWALEQMKMGWQGSEDEWNGWAPRLIVVHLFLDPLSSTSGPLNGNSCAAESERRDSEIAYEKHSSPEAVKT